ncbi:MAG: DUF3450 domain-containing protein [Alphaproteobacteria bacterium]|nr:MAG: DUF3450 domain-containing protein [Alphaproteobacteria bacterium]
MKRTLPGQVKSILTAAILGTGMIAGMMSVPAYAQLDAATSEVKKATEEGRASQKRINQLDDETADIVAKYRQTIDLLEQLREYNAQQRKIIADQERQMVSIREQITNVSDIQREILPLINRMAEGLEAFIALDQPFRMTERTTRVETLKELLPQADVSAAEKYRKALEAYQIENDYGRAIEAYEGNLDDGRQVTFLMIGRVALYYQTLNQNETMMWNNSTREWVSVQGSSDDIYQAIRMAREQIPADLLIVPLPGPTSSAN